MELLAHLSKEAGLRTFAELSEKEILALAISLEEEHGRIYDEYAHALAAKAVTDFLHRHLAN